MSGFRMLGTRGGVAGSLVTPGDLVLGGEDLSAGILATNGAGVWTGKAIASGFITRTTVGAGYTDTTDTSTNILAAIAGNYPDADLVPGTTFRMKFINTIAQTHTFAAGVGVIAGALGSGVLSCAASLVKEYLWTILNASPQEVRNCSTTNGNKVIGFVLPAGQVSIPYSVNGAAFGTSITPGMIVSGTGITAGTRVLGVTQGQGGVTGVTTDTNSTATSAGVSLTFLPAIQVDSISAGTL